jgi:hypothetical protein
MITESEALQKIMNIIATPGEDMTDGECIDQIVFILEELGMPIKEKIDEQIRLSKIQTELNWSQGDKQ